jgi:outer membrane protein assembly factor BamB
MRASSLALSLLVVGTTLALSEDWPRWRGVRFSDMSSETALLKKWPAEGPAKVWMNEDAGLGYSSMAVEGGVIYTMGARDATEYVIALDATTGKEKWSAEAGPLLTNGWGNGPRGTPTVDGDKVYAISGKGSLVCLNKADGAVVWKAEMKDAGGQVPGWGYTESPLIDGKMVLATPGGAKGTMMAYDKLTGSVIWQSADWTDGAHYSSPIAIDHKGQHQIVQLTMQTIAGVNPADGKVLWRSPFPGKTAVIPTPIFHEGKVFVAAGYGVGCKMVELTDSSEPKELYSNTDMVNHHGGVILHEGYLYGFCDGKGWTCMDFATGAVKWAEKKALKKGAIAGAGGQFYLLEEDTGTVALIDASPDGYREHGRFTLTPQTTQRSPKGKVWSHPVIANGKLFVRDQELLFCFDIAAK